MVRAMVVRGSGANPYSPAHGSASTRFAEDPFMPYIDTGAVSLFFGEAGSGGTPVLLLHELGGSSESWRAVIPLLAADRRVIAPDLRCAGRSEKPPGAFTLAETADDLAALLGALNLDRLDV